uniref:Uncharacterized protein n=2 Tax=Anguilla anguilla TaxID=7936 RepID=A0A0E9QHQ0_ANGAN
MKKNMKGIKHVFSNLIRSLMIYPYFIRSKKSSLFLCNCLLAM